jgi:hypothetical protein
MEAAMMTALGLVALAVASSLPLLILGGLLMLAEWTDRRRQRVILRQVTLTDAVHREFGAIVAPVVEKRPGGPWRAVMALPPSRLPAAARLAAIALEVLGTDDLRRQPVEVVFRPWEEDPPRPARSADRLRAA